MSTGVAIPYNRWNGNNIATPKLPGFLVYAGFLMLFFSLTYLSLYRKYGRVRGVPRQQLSYVMLGALLAGLPALITNLLLPLIGIRQLIWLGPLFSLMSVYCVMVAMVKHRMFDIRVLVARSFAYAQRFRLSDKGQRKATTLSAIRKC